MDLHVKKNPNDLIISNKQTNYKNQILLDSPLKITQLMEKINLKILKINFSLNSNISIGRYKLNLNSKEIFYNNIKLDLTEQEVKILFYLSNSNVAVKIEKLQKDIWGYGENLETHTVETHIYRLRKKFLNIFKDDQFILSVKSSYFIK
jgi:DNA-binding response OmpR family regulator